MLMFSGILRDRTMENQLICFPNHDEQKYSFCKLELSVKQYGFYAFGISKFNKSLQILKWL